VVVRFVLVAAVTVAVAPPLNVTVFWPGVGLKPLPKIWTVVPTLPLLGVTKLMETFAEGSTSNRWTRSKFPTASYSYEATLPC
jgi:hypothetical protein